MSEQESIPGLVELMRRRVESVRDRDVKAIARFRAPEVIALTSIPSATGRGDHGIGLEHRSERIANLEVR